MTSSPATELPARFRPGASLGVSPWLEVTQTMVDAFGAATLDPDPMHIDPEWARANSVFGGTVAFGFLTMSLLTHLLQTVLGSGAAEPGQPAGQYLNYGFDRLRLISPVRVGRRIRGRFEVLARRQDERGRIFTTFGCTVEIEGEERPALSAEWLTAWVPVGP
jgi:acyl dehydratase